MSLGPRYSLLTLLFLTAGIAVGIKLWRWPHRVEALRPLPLELAAQFDLIVGNEIFWVGTPDEHYEYEYMRTWQGSQLFYLAGRPNRDSWIVPSKELDSRGYRSYHFMDSAWIKTHDMPTLNLADKRRVIFWIAPSPSVSLDDKVSDSILDHNKEPRYKPPYFVDNQGMIYTLYMGYLCVLGCPIQLTDIPYHQTRVRIAEILSETPESK